MQLVKVPAPQDWLYKDEGNLDGCYKLQLKELGAVIGAYWYATSSYEGCGRLIFRCADGWRYHNMSHCSCYGPFDRLNLSVKPEPTLEMLVETFSDDLKKECKDIINVLTPFKEQFDVNEKVGT